MRTPLYSQSVPIPSILTFISSPPSTQTPLTQKRPSQSLISTFVQSSPASRLDFLCSLPNYITPVELSFLRRYFLNSPHTPLDISTILPSELILLIFSYLDTPSLRAASSVNRSWNKYLNDNILWKLHCNKRDYKVLGKDGKVLSHIVAKIPYRVGLAPWKEVFKHWFLTYKNWEYGRCRVSRVKDSLIQGNLHTYFDPESKLVATIGRPEQPGRIWNYLTGNLHFTIPPQSSQHPQSHTGFLTAIKFNKSYILTGSVDRTLKVWDSRTGACLRTCTGHTGEIVCVEIAEGSQESPLGEIKENLVVTGSEDKKVLIWDIKTGEPLGRLSGHEGAVCCVKFQVTRSALSPSRSTSINSTPTVNTQPVGTNLMELTGVVVTGSSDRTIKKWDMQTQRCIATLRGHKGDVFCVQFSEDYIVSGSADQTIRIWCNHRHVNIKTLEGHSSAVICLQFDDNKIVSGSLDHTIKVWSFPKSSPSRSTQGQLLYTLKHHLSGVSFLRFSKTRLVASGFDCSIVVWDFEYVDEFELDANAENEKRRREKKREDSGVSE